MAHAVSCLDTSVKLLLRFFVAEGMEQSDAPLEILLRSRRTRDRKRNLAELFASFVMMGVHFIIKSYRGHGTQDAHADQ